MQLLTTSRNFVIANTSNGAVVTLQRFTLPILPTAIRARMDVLPSGTVGDANLGLRIQAVGVDGNVYDLYDVTPGVTPIGKWGFRAVTFWGDAADVALGQDGPWELQAQWETNTSALTGPMRGRVELAYWQ